MAKIKKIYVVVEEHQDPSPLVSQSWNTRRGWEPARSKREIADFNSRESAEEYVTNLENKLREDAQKNNYDLCSPYYHIRYHIKTEYEEESHHPDNCECGCHKVWLM